MVIEKGKSDGRHDKCFIHAKWLIGENHLSIAIVTLRRNFGPPCTMAGRSRHVSD